MKEAKDKMHTLASHRIILVSVQFSLILHGDLGLRKEVHLHYNHCQLHYNHIKS